MATPCRLALATRLKHLSLYLHVCMLILIGFSVPGWPWPLLATPNSDFGAGVKVTRGDQLTAVTSGAKAGECRPFRHRDPTCAGAGAQPNPPTDLEAIR
jgi:hypothetical protein